MMEGGRSVWYFALWLWELRKRDEEEEKETIVLSKKRYNTFSFYLCGSSREGCPTVSILPSASGSRKRRKEGRAGLQSKEGRKEVSLCTDFPSFDLVSFWEPPRTTLPRKRTRLPESSYLPSQKQKEVITRAPSDSGDDYDLLTAGVIALSFEAFWALLEDARVLAERPASLNFLRVCFDAMQEKQQRRERRKKTVPRLSAWTGASQEPTVRRTPFRQIR
jgi:hypothetical protein